jgi:3-oxoacyl-[acyl-carrier-protein] synthase-3
LRTVSIIGTGAYLPERVVTNDDLAKVVDTNDEWIYSRTGMRERRIARADQATSDLAAGAAQAALADAGVSADEVDLLIVATLSPDMPFPSTACFVQEQIGAKNAYCYDLGAACSGSLYALETAKNQIACGAVETALIIGAEKMSSMIDWSDRNTCVLFGDGAGAVVLTPSVEAGIINTHLHSDGRYKDLLYYPYGVSDGFDKLKAGAPGGITMQGNDVFKVAVRTLSRLVDETLAKNGIDKHQIDWLVPHQANLRIIKSAADKLDMPMEKVIVTVQDHGNTSAASIPLALDTAVRNGQVKPGQTLLLEGVGGGFTWGAVLLKL